MVMVRAHLYISGRVQGVFFRGSMKEVADRYNVKGWVRNLPDGRVEAVLEGDKESVEKVIKWAHRGSIWSRVEKVEVIWEEYKGEYDSFKIIYY